MLYVMSEGHLDQGCCGLTYYDMMKTWVSSNYVFGKMSALRNSWEGESGRYAVFNCCAASWRFKMVKGAQEVVVFLCYVVPLCTCCACCVPVPGSGTGVLFFCAFLVYLLVVFLRVNKRKTRVMWLLVAFHFQKPSFRGAPPYDTPISLCQPVLSDPLLVLLMGWQDVGPGWRLFEVDFLGVKRSFFRHYWSCLSIEITGFCLAQLL